jgi:uncharacterized protein (TIGR02118 family)
MYCAKIIYPRTSDTFFDFDHYFKVHLPLAVKSVTPYAKVIRLEVDKGEGGMIGTEDMPYHCICSVYFDSADGIAGFRKLFATPEDGQAVADDIGNYTNTKVEFQFSETIEYLK